MSKRRGAILVAALLGVTLVSGLIAGLYMKAVGEKQLALRHANTIKAFWLAEAGIAKVVGSSGLSSTGTISLNGGTYSAVVTAIDAEYYRVTSTGTMAAPDFTVTKTIEATIRTGLVDATKFKYGLESTTNIDFKGSSYIIDPSDSWKEFSILDFADLFGVSKADMKAYATHVYTDFDIDTANINGITWVDVTSSQLKLTSNWTGSGILIINGDCDLAGTPVFDGIIYVIGRLDMSGTITLTGAVLAESSTTVDTELSGNVTINYDPSVIADALTGVSFITKEVVAWKES